MPEYVPMQMFGKAPECACLVRSLTRWGIASLFLSHYMFCLTVFGARVYTSVAASLLPTTERARAERGATCALYPAAPSGAWLALCLRPERSGERDKRRDGKPLSVRRSRLHTWRLELLAVTDRPAQYYR